MPDRRQHRGPAPDDADRFGPAAHLALATACGDLSWLLTRGYAEPSALKLVGDRHRLVERQRTAVRRSACSDAARADRSARCVGIEDLRGQPLRVDGFNLLLTLESALGGAVVLRGRDGCCRDLAGVHGTYRRVAETRPALDLLADWVARWGVGPCAWLLDAPVSNSGRLAELVRATRPDWSAEVVPDPDAELVRPGPVVATADAGVLDRCGPWVSLAGAVVVAGVPGAWVVDFG